MTYEFEWNADKAVANHRKHGVSLHEASTLFVDPLAILMLGPDHSRGEERYLLLGATARRFAEGANVVVVASDLFDVFPDTDAVDEALRALAQMLRRVNASR